MVMFVAGLSFGLFETELKWFDHFRPFLLMKNFFEDLAFCESTYAQIWPFVKVLTTYVQIWPFVKVPTIYAQIWPFLFLDMATLVRCCKSIANF